MILFEKKLRIFAKNSILDIWLGSEYASDRPEESTIFYYLNNDTWTLDISPRSFCYSNKRLQDWVFNIETSSRSVVLQVDVVNKWYIDTKVALF